MVNILLFIFLLYYLKKRYSFKFKKKSSGLWSKVGKIAGIAALIVGSVALTISTAGGAGALLVG